MKRTKSNKDMLKIVLKGLFVLIVFPICSIRILSRTFDILRNTPNGENYESE